MSLSDILGKAAPWLAAAMAGPPGLVAMAVKTAANAMGASAETVDELTQAIATATPEQILALKRVDVDFKVKMQELGYAQIKDLEKIAAEDRASARKAAVDGGTAKPLFWMSVVLLVISLGSEVAVLFIGYPPGIPDIVVGRVLGLLDSVALMVLAFHYGSSAGSAQKTALLSAK